ncbi:MAG: cation diffusion facilitator family transporter [Gammaproteobacteria bacterium]
MHAHSHADPTRSSNKRTLIWVLLLTGGFMVVEFVAAMLTGSLALLADAGHMLRDVVGVAVALFAAWMAERPSDYVATYGYRRYEVLGAFVNGLLLVGLIVYIAIDAAMRLLRPEAVEAWPVLWIGVLGLLVNLAGLWLLRAGAGENINMRGAYLEVLADALGSIGVIAAAIIILLTGWVQADALVALGIALWMIPRTWVLLRDSGRILLEFTPKGLSLEQIGSTIAAHPGVTEVHDLHVWEVTSGFPALSAHVLVSTDSNCHDRRRELEQLLKDRFDIKHTTLQVDHDRRETRISIDEVARART